ncbi:hypothetical protein [Coxiella-like endosymbiont]|uniref:hypothetical protein n=1 Tax=Coxiella-like endosymbiont TaxID=1592897 RepID=UPI00272B4922|nr:hypothetical protein [Coxiella-like endosymbiont]
MEKTYSSLVVGNYFIKRNMELGAPDRKLSGMKLQKMIYMAKGVFGWLLRMG